MAVVWSTCPPSSLQNPLFSFSTKRKQRRNSSNILFRPPPYPSTTVKTRSGSRSFAIVNCAHKDEEVEDLGVKAALSMLRFYKREISPLMPNSCRYLPTCSEYSMEAYKKYGVAKGTILTAWRLCRCNPLGGSGFDPPRWFNEGDQPEQ